MIHVVDVLDEGHVVLNAGSEQGIKRNDSFVVFARDREIRDLDGKNLGVLELVKGYGSITHVQELVSILTSDALRPFSAAVPNQLGVVGFSFSKSSSLLVDRGDFARKV
jgi:hypothetical protein